MKGREVMGFAIWMISTWGCAALFLGIGVFAGSREEPMWFWSGSTVPSEKVRDIPEYNKANARMWKIYSVPYWICGPIFYWSRNNGSRNFDIGMPGGNRMADMAVSPN